jgi:hypothetical protein
MKRVSLLLLCLGLASDARANVYATNIRLNNGTTNVALPFGGSVRISYILNEPATAGVAISVKSGSSLLRTITLTNGNAGTLRGTNAVVWDGEDSNGNTVSGATFSINITASSTGHGGWTQISDDTVPGAYVFEPTGIAVNKNTNSFYYGRVFVANGLEGPNPGSSPGDRLGIQKLNADASPAEESIFSSGGWAWSGNYLSPWKIQVSDDDKIYINDFTADGVVLSFDQKISSNSLQVVLSTNNYPNGSVHLSGPFITGAGTNTQVWMADTNYSGGVGIRRWNVITNGALATNDLGTTIVAAIPGSDLSLAPFDVAVDWSNRIFTIQSVIADGNAANRVLKFRAYNESGTPETNADWAIGSADNSMEGAYGIAVDPTGAYVAVAFLGNGLPGTSTAGGAARVFAATNGASVAILTPGGDHDHTGVAWDNVGNLYTLDELAGVWRVYSPPGTNQATTVALQTIVAPPGPPVLSVPFYSGGQFHFTLNGVANASYVIQTSTNLANWMPALTNVSANATRDISITASAGQTFYRAQIVP